MKICEKLSLDFGLAKKREFCSPDNPLRSSSYRPLERKHWKRLVNWLNCFEIRSLWRHRWKPSRDQSPCKLCCWKQSDLVMFSNILISRRSDFRAYHSRDIIPSISTYCQHKTPGNIFVWRHMKAYYWWFNRYDSEVCFHVMIQRCFLVYHIVNI